MSIFLFVAVSFEAHSRLHSFLNETEANLLQDKPAGIMETCQSYLQTFAYVQGMIVGAAIFSSVTQMWLEK